MGVAMNMLFDAESLSIALQRNGKVNIKRSIIIGKGRVVIVFNVTTGKFAIELDVYI